MRTEEFSIYPKFPGIPVRNQMERSGPSGKFPKKRTTFSGGPHFPVLAIAPNFREFAVPFTEVLVSSTTPLSTSLNSLQHGGHVAVLLPLI